MVLFIELDCEDGEKKIAATGMLLLVPSNRCTCILYY